MLSRQHHLDRQSIQIRHSCELYLNFCEECGHDFHPSDLSQIVCPECATTRLVPTNMAPKELFDRLTEIDAREMDAAVTLM